MNEKIIKARTSDIDAIKTLSNQYQFSKLSNLEKKTHGFLVSDFNESSYLYFIDKAEFFFVLLVNDTTEGFILAYTDKFMDDNEYLKSKIIKVNRPFIIIKQICIDKANLKRGYGKKMYNTLFHKVKNLPIVVAIVIEPYNLASIEFHKKLGFRELFQFKPNDKLQRSMWIKE